jgi:hypothetical protein
MSLYYQVESIIDKRLNKKGKPEYKIKWKDYSFEECSWEPISHLKNVLFMIKEFELNHCSENSTLSTNEDYTTFSKKKRNYSFFNYDIEYCINKSKKNKKKFKNLIDIYSEEKYIKDTLLNTVTDKKSESDFDIIEIEKIKNNYFVVIMNKKPYSYIQIPPLENMKKEFPKKFEKKISLIQKH